MPFFSAAASTNGLNAEPGWRWPSVAMLKVDSPRLVLRPYFAPPTIAFTSPLRGSIDTSEPEIGVPAWPTPRRWSRTCFSACACSARSIEVYTRRPPLNVVFSPYLLTSSCVTYWTKYGTLVAPNEISCFVSAGSSAAALASAPTAAEM